MSTTWSSSCTPEVARPSEFLESLRHEAVHRDPLLDVGPDDARAATRSMPTRVSIASPRLPMVAEMPHTFITGARAFSWAIGEFDLDAALVAQQVVPFVHDNRSQPTESLVTALFGEQNMQALRGCDQHLRQAPVLALLLCRRGVPGAHLHRPTRVLMVEQP